MIKICNKGIGYKYLNAVALAVLISLLCIVRANSQSTSPTPLPTAADLNESERSDKLTGGQIQTADFEPNQPDIRITLNIPSFRLTLWQNGKEVKSYFVGVGMKEHPLYIGNREATELIWNPAWIPPPSDWVLEMTSVSPGEVIKRAIRATHSAK
jgi:murein L,D-transpeptidase YcbB/YkuD